MKLKSGMWETEVSGRGQVYLGIANAGEPVRVTLTETGWTVDRLSALDSLEDAEKARHVQRVTKVLNVWARPPIKPETEDEPD